MQKMGYRIVNNISEMFVNLSFIIYLLLFVLFHFITCLILLFINKMVRSNVDFRIQQKQHSQDISWQARQKTPRLVRPKRPGATDSYEQKRPSLPEICANQEH